MFGASRRGDAERRLGLVHPPTPAADTSGTGRRRARAARERKNFRATQVNLFARPRV
jgi:hypothetical protein